MSAYDFISLSPHDFELLVRDLLQAELGVHVESFKAGRDKGIDLRYTRYAKQNIIVQCKHYAKTGFAGLKSSLAKTEKPKIDKLNPDSYQLVTSVSLSPQNKDDLISILSPYVHRTEDVMGNADLNNLIGRHPEIERKHFKLWLGSTNILQTILSNDVFSRSYVDAAEIKRRISLFVPTPALDRARKILDDRGFCLISGIPGIGKTTTAEMLVAMVLEDGWEVSHLSGGVHEAFEMLKPDARQLFFYDDFLGRTSFRDNSLQKNEDRDLARLLQYCERNKNTKQAILTTREYILVQARQDHEVLHRLPVDIAKCIVSLEDHTSKIRAEILINHLFFYDVSEEIRRHLVLSGAARKIIAHKNYSPRIVEWMCETSLRSTDIPSEFEKNFLQSLDDPSALWSHAFENQISAAAKELVLGLAVLGDRCDPDSLLASVLAYKGTAEPKHADWLALRKGLAELEGNFIRIDADGDISVVRFHNPSVKDFTDRLLDAEQETARAFFANAKFFEQLVTVLNSPGGARQVIDDELFCRKVSETYRAPCPQVETTQRGNKSTLVRGAASVSPRLLKALEFAEARSRSALVTIARLAMAFVSAPDMTYEDVWRVICLYTTAKDVLADTGDSIVTPRALMESLRDGMRDVEDFTAVRDLLEGPDDDDLMEQLANDFLSFVDVELEHIVPNAKSSTELEAYITSIERVAEQFGLEGQVDLDEARAELDELSAKEDYHADMYKEQYHEERYAERLENETVEEMLGSLLD